MQNYQELLNDCLKIVGEEHSLGIFQKVLPFKAAFSAHIHIAHQDEIRMRPGCASFPPTPCYPLTDLSGVSKECATYTPRSLP